MAAQRGREGNSYPFEDGIIKRFKRGEDPIAAHERVRYDMMTRTAGKKGAKKA